MTSDSPERTAQPRRAGMLVPLFSLRSARGWGIGEIGDIAAAAHWRESAGMTLLQVLPINELPLAETSPSSSLSATIRFNSFVSWRTLPGQSYAERRSRARGVSCGMNLPACFAWTVRKWLTRVGISSRLSRSGGIVSDTTFAELPVVHQFREARVGRGDDADVHLLWPLPEGLDLAALEEPQQLRLQVEAEFTDLVDEQRATLGLADESLRVADGAGERATPIPEQLPFEHVARNGGDVERHERPARLS